MLYASASHLNGSLNGPFSFNFISFNIIHTQKTLKQMKIHLFTIIKKSKNKNLQFYPGSAEGAGGETPSEPYVAMCDAHASEVALFHVKVLKIFHQKKIAALWKETSSFFNISACEYLISFQRFYPLNIKYFFSLLWRF